MFVVFQRFFLCAGLLLALQSYEINYNSAIAVTSRNIDLPFSELAIKDLPAELQLNDDIGAPNNAQDLPILFETKATKPKDLGAYPVQYDLALLPLPVRETLKEILSAAHTGEINNLKTLMDAKGKTINLGYADAGDPITFLKEISMDGQGREILAIMIELLQSGYVKANAEDGSDQYIWPYFAKWDLEKLTIEQEVEILKLINYQDLEEMRDFGAYVFYKIGIDSKGNWLFFTAGE